jgi:hypothetical protein
MNGLDLLEKMENIDLKYIEEANKPLEKKVISYSRKVWWYGAGMVASIVIMFISGYMVILGKDANTQNVVGNSGYTATVMNSGMGITFIIMIVALLGAAFMAFLMIREMKKQKSESEEE